MMNMSNGADALQTSQAGYQPQQMNAVNQGQPAAHTSQSSSLVTEMSGINQMLTQPVQDVNSLEMDADLVNTIIQELKQSTQFIQEVNPTNFNFGANLATQTTEFVGYANPYTNIFNTPQYNSLQNRGGSACGLQSRNATGGLLEMFDENDFDIVDGKGPVSKVTAGFDEVDSARIDRLSLEDSHLAISPVSGKMQGGKVHSEHSYAKPVQVVPCSGSQTELRKEKEQVQINEQKVKTEETQIKRQVENKETISKPGVTQNQNPVVNVVDSRGGSAVTQETQQGSKSRQTGMTQPSVKSNPTGKVLFFSFLLWVQNIEQYRGPIFHPSIHIHPSIHRESTFSIQVYHSCTVETTLFVFGI